MWCFVRCCAVYLPLLLITLIAQVENQQPTFDNSILRVPPWPTENCSFFNESTCGPTGGQGCDYRLCPDGANCTINVALILPRDDKMIVNIDVAKHILHTAINDSKHHGIIPGDLHININEYDDECTAGLGLTSMLNAINDCANVVIGPICEYSVANTGRMAKLLGHGGTPNLTPGGFSFNFVSEKQSIEDEYFKLVNSGNIDFRSFGEFFFLMINAFNWTKSATIFDRSEMFEIGGENFCKLFLDSVANDILKTIEFGFLSGNIEVMNKEYSEFLKNEIGVQYGLIVTCTSPKKFRKILIEADKLNFFDKGEYTFFNFQIYHNVTNPLRPWEDPEDPENNERVRKAYKSVFTFMPSLEANFDEVVKRPQGFSLLHGVYDAMAMYLQIINKTFNDDDPLLGCKVHYLMAGAKYQGIDGEFTMNCNAQKAADYVLLHINDTGDYEVVARYTNFNKTITEWNVKWPYGVPLDTPKCGFDYSKCPTVENVNILLITLICVVSVASLIMVGFLYRNYKLKSEIYSLAWKIKYDDIVFIPKKARSQSLGSLKTEDAQSIIGDRGQLYTTAGYYKNSQVALKRLKDMKFDLNHDQLKELKIVKDLSHDNLVKFFGACLDIPNVLVTGYCSKGSLQDILENEQIKLDRDFKMSITMDIVRGMHYLHSSPIKTHGALKSSNCLVNNSFNVKIADFGLHFLRMYAEDIDEDIESHSYWQKQLWTAPEILRMNGKCPQGTQKGDVYSFGIIMHEIVYREGAFYLGRDIHMEAKEIVETVKKGPDSNGGQPLRPASSEAICEDAVVQIMNRCWSEDSSDRPDFTELKNKLKGSVNGNVMDSLLQRMEQYANNLESLVEERTADFLEEKRKCEELLYQLLPRTIAQQLILGEAVVAESFDQVTIYFSDIVGFTALSAESTPLQVVDLLNDLYTCFDSIIEHFDVYKVETIGDAYMVVSGLPLRNENRHAREIARMSLALLNAVKQFKIRHRPNEPLQLRIGIHTGPCVAGVVGLKMPRYCLFGDTVNTASRMESNGLPLKIHVSPVTKKVLDSFGTFDIERRGEVEMKGKGKMVTYWLNGETPSATATPSQTLQQPRQRKLPTTPIPTTKKDHGKTAKPITFQTIDDADVPLLSVTSDS